VAETLTIALPDELIEKIAERAAEMVGARTAASNEPPNSPYMTTLEAAEYLRCSRQRIYDLLSAGRLPRLKEGGRTLVARADLDHLVHP